MSEEASPLLGAMLDDYRIVEQVGRGGIGGVFRAVRMGDDRMVAVKTLAERYADDSEVVHRFLRGAREIRPLRHPNIVQVLDVGQCRGIHYMVMEYVDGPSVKIVMDNAGMWRSLNPSRVCSVATQIASALVFCEEHRIVHRDIKPANILLENNGLAKLADLELARRVDDPEPSFGDDREGFLGTLAFMPLEQVLDPDTVDHRCDIYSLGASMYGMLTGRPPYLGSGEDLVDLISRGEFPSVRELRPMVPESFAAVIDKTLAVYPEDRYQAPTDLVQALKAVSRKERWN